MKAPAHHLVGDFCGLYSGTPAFSRTNPVSDTALLVKSQILILGLQNMITLVIGEPVLVEVTLVTNFSWMVSKMTLSSTKLYK